MFEGEQIHLRAPRPEDFATFHQWWSDPEIARFQLGNPIRLNQEATNVAMFERWFSDGGNDVGFTIAQRADDMAVGLCNLWGANIKNRSAMMGILLGKLYWGQGYGSEALELLLDYAFRELNLHRVELGVFSFNERAAHVYKKLGFREVGRRRETLFREGAWHDEVMMDMLQREYLAAKQNQG